MKWFAEHRLFTVVAGIIVALCLVIIISFAAAGGSGALGRGIQSGISWIQRPLSSFTRSVKENVGGIFRYKELQKENKALQAKVDALQEENKNLRIKKSELRELRSLSKSFDFKPFAGTSKAVAARVIEIDESNPYVVFTVDAGTKKHVKRSDIVVNGSGLVGRVQEAGKNYSKIVSILSSRNSISFRLERRSSVTGVLKGSGHGELSGYVMNENMSVLKGDRLITSGIGIYPEGIEIGTIRSIEYDEDTQLKVIKVKPTVNFGALQKVAIYYEY